MQQAQTQSVVQPLPAKTPVAPASQTAPLPLDPNLFRHVGGGDAVPTATAGPVGSW
jgi:hypothetical protein